MLRMSVSAIRKAQGKPNPSDYEANTAQYEMVVNDYVDDLERAMRAAWPGSSASAWRSPLPIQPAGSVDVMPIFL
ncbi:hypothetical protein SB783_41295, partial [Paraburkholderia sp. SIMBA_009]